MYLVSSGGGIVVHSPAKINLFLEVLGRRLDGFHEIETCMAAISLFDRLELQPAGSSEIRFFLDAGWGPRRTSPDVPGDARNLVVRALDRLRTTAGINRGVDVRLAKRIPSGAGLGGASSNAAAALLAANRLWKLNWPLDRLATVAATIGSDVVFFLGGPSPAGAAAGPMRGAICRGRGERVESVGPVAPLHLVVVQPPVGLGTAEVYRHCQPATVPISVDRLRTAWLRGDLARLGQALFNRLTMPAAQLSPWIERVAHVLRRLDSPGSAMSGSGSSSFALARSPHHARRLATLVQAAGAGTAFPVTTIPLGIT